MSYRSRGLGFLLGVVLMLPAVLCASSCTPEHREAVTPYVVPLTRAACILLRAVTTSGAVDEVCATAEELAPFISEILAARGAGDERPSGAIVAFAFPAPARRVPRRRCVAWEPIPRRSDVSEAGGDGGR